MERDEILTSIWRRALQREAVGMDENFFDLGGDSLMAVELFLEIERALGVRLPITAIYDAPTIAEQIALIDAERCPSFSPLVLLKDGDDRAPFYIVHGVGGTVIEFAALGKQIATTRAVYALQARGLDGTATPLERVEEMAAAYVAAIRAKQPQGPYYIGGYSFGGLVALEMARLLGPQSVGRLVMIDAYAHPHTWPLKTKAQVRTRKLLSRAKAFARRPASELAGFVKRRTMDRATYVNNWLGAVDPNLPLPLRRTRIAGDAALIAYTPKPYEGRATFIRAGKTGTVFPSDACNVWQRLIGHFELQTTQGDHRSILVEHAPMLAARIGTLLSSPASIRANGADAREGDPDVGLDARDGDTWIPFPSRRGAALGRG